MPKRVPIPIEEVLSALEEKLPGAVTEQDGQWVWLLEPDLAPLHQIKGGCACDECKARAGKRETVKSIGFLFSFKPHPLKSGKTSRWGHSAMAPRAFHHKSKTKTTSSGGSKPIVTSIEQDDRELAEAEAFFNQ